MEKRTRPHKEAAELNSVVGGVLDDIRRRGDVAVKEYELKFDKVALDSLKVTDAEIREAESLVSDDLKAALEMAHQNIKTFHEAQRFEGKKIQTQPGVTCWQKAVAIERVGLYVPGGTAPLFSTVLMLATPAKIAGCKEIVLCSPPNREGKLHPVAIGVVREPAEALVERSEIRRVPIYYRRAATPVKLEACGERHAERSLVGVNVEADGAGERIAPSLVLLEVRDKAAAFVKLEA